MEIAAQFWESAASTLRADLLIRLVVATVLGGLVGWEREASGKPAGLRTNILICVGSALLTDLSIRFVMLSDDPLIRADPARIAAQIVSGIGFLGAGTIIQARGSVSGLTTAATLWVVAAIGMAVGSGHYVEAVGTTALVLLVLYPLGKLEGHLLRSRKGRTLRVELDRSVGVIDELVALMEEAGLRVRTDSVELSEARVTATFDLTGRSKDYTEARRRLLDRSDVRGLHLG